MGGGNGGASMSKPEYLTIADVAALLRVSKPTVRKAIAEQGLPAVRLGERVYRFARADVDTWLAEQAKRNNGRRTA
jgi:excisionase family DNA binding protein